MARRPLSSTAALAGLALVASLLATTGPALAVGSAPVAAPVEPGRTVVAAGSLQSEAGCPGDWDPACTGTELTQVGTSSTYAATLDLPAGSYEFKVAVGGTWDENYGLGGVEDGANIPLLLAGGTSVTLTYDHDTHVTRIGSADLRGGVQDGDAALATDSLRAPLTREQFYFVMADRFANGDTANDAGGLVGGRLETGLDPTDSGFYHGGDLAGLTQQLDYIEGLGTTAIWLTPSFTNRPVQGTGADASAGYHGYWITDFTTVDPHLGTNDDMRALIDAAHARGMKVFFDIITNHTADVIGYAEPTPYTYVDKATSPFTDAAGVPFDDRDYAGTDTFPTLDETSFPYTPVFRTPADADVKVPDVLDDPTMYHNRGESTFAGESSEYGDFVGLDDLFTERPEVVDAMGDIYETWVDFGIDGFRIDTVKHVNKEFWQQFSPRIMEHAADVGNDDFFVFGEVYDAQPEFMSRYTTTGRLPATLDFGFQSSAVGFAGGDPTTGLRDLFANDDWYTDTDSNAYELPTFLGNHDMGRVGMMLAGQGFAGDELLDRDLLAHELMYLVRGQPVVYYGDEQGFTGDGGDKAARQDMFASAVASYNDDAVIGGTAGSADRYDTGAPLYEAISQMAELRSEHPALADGTQVHRYASADAGLYAVSRIDAAEQVEYLVVANNSTTAQSATLSTYLTRGAFRPLYGTGTRLRTDAEGRATVTVDPLSVSVWQATRSLRHRSAAPAVTLTSPAVTGGVVGARGDGTRAEIRAAVPENAYAQVTFAYREAGTTDWTPLGTDDNAPYRVFQDLAGVPDGTLLEYRAVLRDSSGNLSASSGSGVVGEPAGDGGGGGGGGGVDPVEQPAAVSVPGSHQSEIGCPGDWQPECALTTLTLRDDDIWSGTYDVPAGQYEYKAAINGTWDENYGAGGVSNGPNIAYTAPGGPVSFYYDHRTHWATSTAQGPVVTLAGSFQSEIGCAADWSPDCMVGWLQDPDGDGVYTYATTQLPAGSYETKVAHGLSWDENYGADGARDGANIAFSVGDGTLTRFSYDLATHVLTVTSVAPGASPDLGAAKAQWVSRDVVAWPADAVPAGPDGASSDPALLRWRLHWAADGGLGTDAEAVTGGSSAALTYDPAGLPPDVLAEFPQLTGYLALRLDRATQRQSAEILRGQVAVAQYDDLGRLTDATGVQVPGVLDDLYAGAADAALGLTWRRTTPTLALWAPTAKTVTALVWTANSAEPQRVRMRRDADGVWSANGNRGWRGGSYLYEVTVWAPTVGAVVTNQVTDPYSVGLSLGSQRSLVVDLADRALQPAQWRTTPSPALDRSVDSTIYELHVRDFSVGDETVPAEHRGTYAAFADDGAGRQHLQELADAGLTTVHLLPTFDITSIPEDPAATTTPACDLPSLPPDSPEQQACVLAQAATDGFNWGYDPYHWMTPEGSYSTDPDGTARTVEFREMVGALHADGLRVVLDQVFNHTSTSGQADTSVLDRIVPGYYQRLSATGAVETSTCCQNVATEHTMAGQAMVDAVVLWARAYKVDGFRFDLMGHHSRQNMLDVRTALDGLTLARDGVDGEQVTLYGEGWNFGEVADDALFVQARQGNLGGTGIATFSDRLRDAVRGGGPFDEDPRVQGFGSGLAGDPNGSPANGDAAAQAAALAHATDLLQVGLAGNLRSFEMLDSTGTLVRGDQVDYNGQPAGYADQPDEIISYVDAHDNETLWDALTFKLPVDTAMEDRVRMNTLSLATTTLSQTPSFWHAGADLLRSKSLDRNSYDSGDWFNSVDWTGQDNGFGRGLPPAPDNEAKWPYQQPLLADPSLRPAPADIAAAAAGAEDLLRLHERYPLLRLGSAERINEMVTFPASGTAAARPGVVVMRVDDTTGADVDPALAGLLLVFNASPDAVTQTVPGSAGDAYRLSPVQAGGADPVVRTTTWDAAAGTVTVPGRTVAVLVQPTS